MQKEGILHPCYLISARLVLLPMLYGNMNPGSKSQNSQRNGESEAKLISHDEWWTMTMQFTFFQLLRKNIGRQIYFDTTHLMFVGIYCFWLNLIMHSNLFIEFIFSTDTYLRSEKIWVWKKCLYHHTKTEIKRT